MTPEEFKQKMEELKNKFDPEKRHDEADKLLCEALSQLGYSEGIEIYNEMILW